MSTGFRAELIATLRAVLGDRYAVVTMIGAVVLYSFFYPVAYRHEVASNLPVVVVDEDHSALSRTLLRRIEAVRAVRLAGVETSVARGRAQMEAGNAEAVVLIPAGFQRDILRGRSGQVVLLGDGAYLGRASSVLTGLAEAITAFAREAAVRQASFMGAPAALPVTLVQRPLFNTREGYGSGIVPGVAELIVHQTLLIGIGVLLGTRRQQLGRRLRFDGKSLAGIACAFALIGVLSQLYYAGFTSWMQDYPRGGNLPGVLLGGALFIAATVAFALFVGSFFDSRERAFQYITAISIVLFFLSGLSWPTTLMPPALQWLATLLPTTPGINLMVRLNQMGASLGEVRVELCNLVLLALAYAGLAAWRYRMPASARLRSR